MPVASTFEVGWPLASASSEGAKLHQGDPEKFGKYNLNWCILRDFAATNDNLRNTIFILF